MIVQIREEIPVIGGITQFLDAAVIFSPSAAVRQPGLPSQGRGVVRISCAEKLPEVFCQHAIISMTNPFEHITLEVYHTLLERGPKEDLSKRTFKISYTIGNKQASIFYPSLPQCHKYILPPGGTLTGTVEYAKYLPALVFLYSHCNVKSLQVGCKPLLNITSLVLDHLVDGRFAILLAIYFFKYFAYLRLSKSLTIQAAYQQLTFFFLISQKSQDGGKKVAVSVTRHPDLAYFALAVTTATTRTVSLIPLAFAKKLTALGRHHTLDHQFNQFLQAFFPVQMLDKCFRKLFHCKIHWAFFISLTLFTHNAKLSLKTFSYDYARHTLGNTIEFEHWRLHTVF